MEMKIRVVPHDPHWRQAFQQEAEQLAHALGDTVLVIHHIGSTAIPAIYAKPIIDVLIVVKNPAAFDEKEPIMEAFGYEALGEFGIPGRRYFRRDNQAGERTHQIHAFENGSSQVARHLAFRDYMIGNPDAAREYSDLKRKLAANYPDDSEAYMDGKDAFIQDVDRRAEQRRRA